MKKSLPEYTLYWVIVLILVYTNLYLILNNL